MSSLCGASRSRPEWKRCWEMLSLGLLQFTYSLSSLCLKYFSWRLAATLPSMEILWRQTQENAAPPCAVALPVLPACRAAAEGAAERWRHCFSLLLTASHSSQEPAPGGCQCTNSVASLRTEELHPCFLLIAVVPFCDSLGSPKWVSSSFNTQLGLLLVWCQPLGFFFMLKEEKKIAQRLDHYFFEEQMFVRIQLFKKSKATKQQGNECLYPLVWVYQIDNWF